MKFKGLYKKCNIVNQYQNFCRGVCIADNLNVDVFLYDNYIHIIVTLPCPNLTKGDNIVALFVCDNNKNYVTIKYYEVVIQEPFVKEIEHTLIVIGLPSLIWDWLYGSIIKPTYNGYYKFYTVKRADRFRWCCQKIKKD